MLLLSLLLQKEQAQSDKMVQSFNPHALELTHTYQKAFSNWFLFVTLYQLFSFILERSSLMLRFEKV